MKAFLSTNLKYITIGIVLLMAGSLYFGWLHPFFFGAEHAHVQGIDYFAVPKSYLNLLEKRSIYDTWGGEAYGPYSTWYLAHPAFSVFVASWFSYFSPWLSYALFIVFSYAILFFSAFLLSKAAESKLKKQFCYFILLCAFPTYWVMYVGNMHAPLVLALTLIFLGIFELTYKENTKAANQKLFAGLLICLFTKPIVLLMLPLFLVVKETRKITIQALLIYGFVSLLFIIVPILNPQAMGWNQLMNIAFDPDFIKQNLNIFKNNFVINEYMKDNSIHWLNLIAQSEYKLMHIDVFSLPVFMDTLLGHETSAKIYKLPIYICLLFSSGVGFIADKKIRLESTLLLVMAISLTFFLSYNTVWEYQFASVLPLIALFPILKERNVFYKKYISFMIILGLLICLPSGYFLMRTVDYQSSFALTIIRLNRILPVLFIFLVMIAQLISPIVKNSKLPSLKGISNLPSKLFFE